MRISDWSSDVCSSDLGEALADWRSIDFSKMRHVAREGDKVVGEAVGGHPVVNPFILVFVGANTARERNGIQKGQILAPLSPSALLKNGRAPCRERVCQSV